MADKSRIEWTDATWNPITGCSLVSPGCIRCYAMRDAAGRLKNHPSREGLTDKNGRWNGKTRFNEQWLDQPIRWRKQRRIFVCAHGDLFHENVPDEWIDRVFAVMALAPLHVFQVLTKRAKRMKEYMRSDSVAERVEQAMARYWTPLAEWPLPNVWMGVSAEDQATLDARTPHLLNTPAAVRWLSVEPLLGPVDLTMIHHDGLTNIDSLRGNHGLSLPMKGRCSALDWVVVGGESGPKARPMHPDWARAIRDQCAGAAVPFFFKQWGEWIEKDGPRCRAIRIDRHSTDSWMDPDGTLHPCTRMSYQYRSPYFDSIVRRVGKKRAGRLLDGRTHDEMPEAARG